MNFTLEKYNGKNRYTCPGCNRRKVFTRYVDIKGNYISPHVGRCDRENNCGYHLTPKEYKDNGGVIEKTNYKTPLPSPPVYLPREYFKETIDYDNLQKENLFKYFSRFVDKNKLLDAFTSYNVGVVEKWKTTALVFWHIDLDDRVTHGKIMSFDKSGHRSKFLSDEGKVIGLVSSIHKELSDKGLITDNYRIQQCYFGTHLAKLNPSKKICIVESEKTAIWASIAYPDNVWLATGSMLGLTLGKTKELVGRNVELFPDIGPGVDRWKEKIPQLSNYCKISINPWILANNKTKYKGWDLLDFAEVKKNTK